MRVLTKERFRDNNIGSLLLILTDLILCYLISGEYGFMNYEGAFALSLCLFGISLTFIVTVVLDTIHSLVCIKVFDYIISLKEVNHEEG